MMNNILLHILWVTIMTLVAILAGSWVDSRPIPEDRLSLIPPDYDTIPSEFFTDTISGKILFIHDEEITEEGDNLSTSRNAQAVLGICTQPVPLGDWTKEGVPSYGNWNLSGDQLSVIQTVNSGPTFFVSDDNFCNTTIRGSFRVETRSDDDFAGFVLGYTSSSDYLLVDWKQRDQTAFGAFGPEGFRLSRIQGGQPNITELWGKTGPYITVLDEFLGPTEGWADLTTYNFTFEYSANRLQVFITGGIFSNTKVIDITPDPILDPMGFPCGKFGFYNLSQARVRYSGFAEEFSVGINFTNVTCNGFDDGTVTAEPNMNFPGPYTYIWEDLTNGDILPSSQSISGLEPGTYAVMVVTPLPDNCMAFDTITIIEPDPLTTMINSTDDLCGNNQGSISFSGTAGGTPPYEYSIDGLSYQTGASFTGLGAGPYLAIARDLNGCADTTMIMLIGDILNPMITCPSDISVNNDPGACSAFISIDQPIVSDDCGILSLINDYTGTNNASSSYGVGDTTVMWTVTDVNGNTASCSFMVTVTDVESPMINCPPDPGAICPTDLDGLVDTITDFVLIGGLISDNCRIDTASFLSSEIVVSFACPRTLIRTFTISDDAGNASSCTQMISVTDNESPVFSAPPDTSIACDSFNTSQTIYETSFPSNPLADGWIFSDGTCLSNSVRYQGGQNRIVIDNDGPPNNSCIASIDRTFDLTGFYAFRMSVTAYQSANASYEGIGTGGINRRDSLIVEYSTDGGINFIRFFADPEVWNASSDVEMTSGSDGNPVPTTYNSPILTLPTASENDLVIRILGRQGDGGAERYFIDSFSITGVQDLGDVLNESDNCITREAVFEDIINPLPGCPDVVPIQRIWTLSDDCGNIFRDTQLITLLDTVAPMIISPARDSFAPCVGMPNPDSTFLYWINTNGGAVATDNCGPITWTTNVTEIPACMDQAVDFEVYFIAIDACGNRDSTMATFSVFDDEPPTILQQADTVVVQCDGMGNQQQLQDWIDTIGGASAIDNCGEVAWFNDFTGYTFDCGGTDTIRVQFIAFDACANKDTTLGMFIIQDTTKPVFLSAPLDITVDCDPEDNLIQLSNWLDTLGGAVATDTCSGVSITPRLEAQISGCIGNDTSIYFFVAEDACGNKDSLLARFIVQDTTPPSFVLPPPITIQCDEDRSPANTGMVTSITDSCDSSPAITFFDDTVNIICADQLLLERFWIAADACGNQDTMSQFIAIQDTTKPTFIPPVDTTINCEESADTMFTGSLRNISDNCSGMPVVTFSDDTISGMPMFCGDTILRTFRIEDNCGNFDTYVQTIAIQDTTPPTFTVPNDTIIGCNMVGVFDVPPITGDVTDESDNCSTGSQATYSDNIMNNDTCRGEQIIMRIWTLLDDCGNMSQDTQMIRRIDTVPPTFTVPEDVVISCDQDPMDLMITGDVFDEMDNCDLLVGEATFTDISNTLDICTGEGTIVREWSLVDSCNNITVQTQTITVNCAVMVDAGPDIVSCSNGLVTLNESMITSPVPTIGTWSTSGDGTFEPGIMFPTALSYRPGLLDIENGSVVLTLIAELQPGCGSVYSDSFTVTIQKVNCGTFPWRGN